MEQLKTAPMIEECSINMECELVKTVDFPNHDVFIGKIVSHILRRSQSSPTAK